MRPGALVHGSYIVEFNKGRIKIIAAPLDAAEVWGINGTALDGTSVQRYCIIGPALPGSVINVGDCGGTIRIRTLEACPVVLHGAKWMPTGAFAGMSRAAWAKLAASACAWRRAIVRQSVPPSARGRATVPAHAQFSLRQNPIGQMPPMFSKTARGTIICSYCRRAFTTSADYENACAPECGIYQANQP